MNDNPYWLVGIDQIRTPADWRKLRPAPPTCQTYQEYLDGLKEILDAVGHETMVLDGAVARSFTFASAAEILTQAA